jgi:phosphotransferase system enzyme I (PtsI)
MNEPREIPQEIRLKGIPASPGIAIGIGQQFRKAAPFVEERPIEAEDVLQETERLHHSLARSKKELQKILTFAETKLGAEESKIFEAQLMILDDVVLFQAIESRIGTEFRNVEFIVFDEIEKYRRLMESSGDEYTQERAHDVEDLRNRILRNLHEEKLVSKFERPSIIVSPNLSAADTLILSRNEVLAYVTEIGGITSHMALLARALKIPTVVGVRHVAGMIHADTQVIVDGYSGTVVLHPSPTTLEEFRAKRDRFQRFEADLAELRDLPAETTDGRRVELSANIELEQELEFIRFQGADGIGLYRSETLLIGKEAFPSEEEQYRVYKNLADSMYPRSVIIRTFDIGGDKMMAHPIQEHNPFLGWRGIRVLLDKEELFLDQLRAILRASTRRNLRVMFPMITSLKEVRKAKTILERARHDLRSQKVPFDERMAIGVMVEVPSAAVIAEDLAKEVDFLSIGTNDLIQYLLAVDRSNDVVSDLYDEFHPAVVRFLRRIIERGKKGKVWVGMCGEMAGDPLATVLLLGLGLDEFSVVPRVLPEIKKIIRSVSTKEARKVAKHVLTLDTEDDIRAYLVAYMRKKMPDVPLE